MNAAQAIAALTPLAPAALAARCPWCRARLDGEVLATFRDGTLTSLSQTRLIGARHYVWMHAESGCHVPELTRISPAITHASPTVTNKPR